MSAPRRQRRGLERIEHILDAATRVFADVGYARATTNAIAAEAGISPGSLYQYFRDKQDIANSVWQRYGDGLVEVVTDVQSQDLVDVPLASLLDRVVDPLHELKTRHGALAALLATVDDASNEVSALSEANGALQDGLERLIAARNPHLGADAARTATAVCFALFETLLAGDTITGDATTDLVEVKAAMHAYLSLRGVQ